MATPPPGNLTPAEPSDNPSPSAIQPPPAPTTNPSSPFLALPVELQVMIWEHTLPGPRVFECAPTGIANPTGAVFRQRHPDPAATQVCRLSRSVALSTLTRAFATADVRPDTTTPLDWLFAPGTDILYLDLRAHAFGSPALLSPAHPAVRNLAVEWLVFSQSNKLDRVGRLLAALFPSVAVLYVFVRDARGRRAGPALNQETPADKLLPIRLLGRPPDGYRLIRAYGSSAPAGRQGAIRRAARTTVGHLVAGLDLVRAAWDPPPELVPMLYGREGEVGPDPRLTRPGGWF